MGKETREYARTSPCLRSSFEVLAAADGGILGADGAGDGALAALRQAGRGSLLCARPGRLQDFYDCDDCDDIDRLLASNSEAPNPAGMSLIFSVALRLSPGWQVPCCHCPPAICARLKRERERERESAACARFLPPGPRFAIAVFSHVASPNTLAVRACVRGRVAFRYFSWLCGRRGTERERERAREREREGKRGGGEGK